MPKNFDELFKDWEVKPCLFADGAAETFVPQLEVLDPGKIGYAGPRARLPVPNTFFDANHNKFSEDYVSKIIRETIDRGLHKIVIAYPTRDTYLGDAKKSIKYWFRKLYPGLHWDELARLGNRSYDQKKLYSAAKELFKQAKKNNIEVEFLPMVKLTQVSVRTHQNSFDPVSPIRFWTANPPPSDAAYIFMDDIMARGSTFAGMMSLLMHHGVLEENFLWAVIGNGLGDLKLSDLQKQTINTLRKDYPDTAARADIILDLVGIGGMEALTYCEADALNINEHFSPHDVVHIEQKLQRISNVDYDGRHYEPIPEPDTNYVDRLKKVGLTPVARTK